MRRIGSLLALALIYIIGVSRPADAAEVEGNRGISERLLQGGTTATKVDLERSSAELSRTITTQQRLNRYFHETVVPRLKSCWSGIQGGGWVVMEHVFARGDGGKWESSSVKVKTSTLPEGQNPVALRCMKNAVNGTSFEPDPGDGPEAKRYFADWRWPVPIPVNLGEVSRRIFSTNQADTSGWLDGCDGAGTMPSCLVCDENTKCKYVCVGWKTCTISKPSSDIDKCEVKDRCASGGIMGLVGRRVPLHVDSLPQQQLEQVK